MILYSTIEIAKHELGLVYGKQGYLRTLAPGKHRISRINGQNERVEKLNLREAIFTHQDLDILLASGDLGTNVGRLEVPGNSYAVVWVNGVFHALLRPGRYGLVGAFNRVTYDMIDTTDVFWTHKRLNEITPAFGDDAEVFNLAEEERALIWLNGRINRIASTGTFVVFKSAGQVKVELASVDSLRFQHQRLSELLRQPSTAAYFTAVTITTGELGLVSVDGALTEHLQAGTYAFWKGSREVTVQRVSLKEETLDIAGQEIMTADNVTLRLNALLTYVISDPQRFATVSKDTSHAIYREAQLALREAVGSRILDNLLTEKDGLASEVKASLENVMKGFGVLLKSFGIRDIILPGEMKDLLNKVIEARKAAEASLITRREETAAARMQANTAKVLASSPHLLRMRELEALERVSQKANLTVVLGEGGLTDRITKLL